MKKSDLAGKTVVLTGKFQDLKRSEAEAALRAIGAKIGSGVSKETDFLFVGEKAGSKLKKAQALGIPVHDEAALAALLSGEGVKEAAKAAAKKVDAKKKAAKEERAEAREASAAEGTPMQAAVAELRAFLKELKKRPDVRVEVANLGRKLNKGQVEWVKKHIHPELGELFAEMNGAHIEWRFVEPPGMGCLRIPQLTQWTRFTGDDEHYMNFGEDYEALLLDEITPEGNTWLVRDKEDKSVRIVFASAAEGGDGVRAAGSIPEYLRAAIDHGLVPYWPRCFKESRHVSYAEQESWVTRFRAPAVKPSPIRPGVRVQFGYFSEGGRGEVLRVHSAPPSRLAEFCGTELAEVRLDLGGVAWIPQKWMKAAKKQDAYERLRDPDLDLAQVAAGGVEALVFDLARAIGPLGGYSTYHGLGVTAGNARLAAGILATRGLSEATAQTLAIHDEAKKAKLDLGKRRKLEKTGEELNPNEWSRFRWELTPEVVFLGLFDGLKILAHHASAAEGKPGKKLLPAATMKRLAEIPQAKGLSAALESKGKLEAPNWAVSDRMAEDAEALGLPKDAQVFHGTGY